MDFELIRLATKRGVRKENPAKVRSEKRAACRKSPPYPKGKKDKAIRANVRRPVRGTTSPLPESIGNG